MENIKIIIASDSIGDTAELVASACVAQFNPKACKHGFLRYPYIETFKDIDEVIQVAIDKNAIIVDAIEFAVKYDDGKDAKGLPKADIVLIGISRTSKTPLSQYLAHKSYKVMNIPLVPEVTPPDELFKINPNKCIALKISEDKLNLIRKQRLKQLGLGEHARYATEDRIKEEIQYFEKIVEKIGCPVIDVSDKAIEETANDVIQIIESKA